MKNKKGFTVVEILLVLAILLLITSFTVPKVFSAIAAARKSAASSTLNTIVSIFHMADEFAAFKGISRSDNEFYTITIPTAEAVTESDYCRFISRQISTSFEGKLDGKYKIVLDKTALTEVMTVYYLPPDEKNTYYKWINGQISQVKKDLSKYFNETP